jgi:hypothetical protein
MCKLNDTDGMYYLQGEQVPMNGVNLVGTADQGETWNDVTMSTRL